MILASADALVALAGGFLLGEVLDVWYDGKVYYEKGEKEARIFEPMPFYFGQIKYKVQFRLPESYEHYHWGIWLLTMSLMVSAFVPAFLQNLPLFPIGVAISLVLDENRTGISGHPFGIGKEFTRLSLFLGVLLAALLVTLSLRVVAPTDPLVLVIAGVFPFLAMPLIHFLESKGILREPWP